MDLEILKKKENPVLKRVEVSFRLTHPKEKTPQRQAVRDKIAATVGGKRDGVIIAFMRSRFGSSVTEGYAKVYDSSEAAKKLEPQFVLKRHGLVEAKAAEAKADTAKPAEKPAKAPEKGAEKPPARAPEKAAEKPPAKPAEKPADKAPAKPAEKAAEKPAKPSEKATEKSPAKPHAEKK